MDLRCRRHSWSKEEEKDAFFAILFDAREAGTISSLTGIHSNWNSFTAGWSVKYNSIENMLVDPNKVKSLHSCVLALLLLDIYPREMRTYAHVHNSFTHLMPHWNDTAIHEQEKGKAKGMVMCLQWMSPQQ